MDKSAAMNDNKKDTGKTTERIMSQRIAVLLVVATLLLIGQSYYNLTTIKAVDHSIEVVNEAAFNLDTLSRKIKTPIADARILSMEMVSAPNRQSVAETKAKYDALIAKIDSNLISWKALTKRDNSEDNVIADAYTNMSGAWTAYKAAVKDTFYYIDSGVRVAAFISVTGPEKEKYNELQASLNIFSEILVQRSKDVFTAADEKSAVAHYSLIITAVIQVLILIATLFFVFRMFRTYMRSAQAYEHEIEAKEAQLRTALSSMSDGLYTLDKDMRFTLFNDRFPELIGIDKSHFQVGQSFKVPLRKAAEVGSLGDGNVEDLIQKRVNWIEAEGYQEWEFTTHGGRILSSRKSDMADGGAIVVVSDVTERRHGERELKDAFHKISSSIQYASKIQQSILPHRDFLMEAFEDHFIYWEPRDVVGGDIYWFYEWGDGVLMCLGDCTGHGVPGAFMTLISTGALERALSEVEVGDLSELISKMNVLLQQSLGQHSGTGLADDGLELGICYIENKKQTLSFVGAKFDLLIVDHDEVETIKGGRKGLGYREIPSDYKYEQIELTASPTAQYYLTTDGILDQKGAQTRKRLGKKGFQDLLLNVHQLPMKDQAKAIHSALLTHQGQEVRRDDIAIIGFKIG